MDTFTIEIIFAAVIIGLSLILFAIAAMLYDCLWRQSYHDTLPKWIVRRLRYILLHKAALRDAISYQDPD